MKFIKGICLLSLVIIGSFAFLIKFSAIETKFKCSSDFSSGFVADQQTHPKELYMKLHSYRWWVWLWNKKSDGAVWLEAPNRITDYFERIVEVGDQLQFYDFNNNPRGYFSNLSNFLSTSTSTWAFDGKCMRIED